MTNFKDFYNFYNIYTNNERIFSREDVGKMTSDEFSANEDGIIFQMNSIGIPTNAELGRSEDVVFVNEYVRDDGTIVKAHYRSKPDSVKTNNFSYEKSEPKKLDNENMLVREGKYKMDKAALGANKLLKEQYKNLNNIANIDKPLTKQLFNVFVDGVENTPDDGEYIKLSNEHAPNLKKYINKSGAPIYIDSNWQGLAFKNTSELSEKVSKSNEVHTKVNEYYKTPKKKKFINLDFTNEGDLFTSLGHATIVNPQIENGEFHGILVDVYDFNNIKYIEIGGIIDVANNFAFTLQELSKDEQNTKEYKTYYLMVPIKFKMESK